MKARRPAVLATSIGLGIAALLGVLGLLHGIAPDDEALRSEVGRSLLEIDAMSATDPGAKDRRLEELLAVEDYKKYARSLWLKLDRMHGPVHQAAQADRAAGKAVPPFLARCSALDGRSPDDLRALEDEARALQNDYGATRFGAALTDARRRIAATLAGAAPACSTLDHFRLEGEIEKDRLAGRFAAAVKRIVEDGAAHPRCGDFGARLRRIEETVRTSATQAAEKLLEHARRDRAE
ncbi:MAG TPA: hypothetical protein VKW04_14190, partial [Planctomycetota bacterium]|nr:hypothetical protein [Planctomycetota bacterium]